MAIARRIAGRLRLMKAPIPHPWPAPPKYPRKRKEAIRYPVTNRIGTRICNFFKGLPREVVVLLHRSSEIAKSHQA